MNYSNIETFLKLAETRNFTKTAEELFLAQSTISYRIKSLEQELGINLIQREQGKGYITLTVKGEEFINIAHKWKSILKDTNDWKTQNSLYKLKIASVDSLNTCVFSEFYKKVLRSDSPLILNVGTHWTVTIHNFIENYETDLGFVSWEVPSKNIISKPLFSERFILISSIDSNLANSVHPKDLDPKSEICLNRGPSFQAWHDYWWDSSKKENSTVDTISLLRAFLDVPDFWSVVPISVAKTLMREKPIKISEIEDAPPDRVCFKITNRNPLPRNLKSLEILDEHIKNYINSDFFKSLIS